MKKIFLVIVCLIIVGLAIYGGISLWNNYSYKITGSGSYYKGYHLPN